MNGARRCDRLLCTVNECRASIPPPFRGKRIKSIERCARHCGTPAFDGAEGTVPGTDPGEPEDAGYHDHGGRLRLPQPADRKRVSGVAQGLARNEYPDRRDVVRGIAVSAEVSLGALRGPLSAAIPGAPPGVDTAYADCPCGGDSAIRVAEPCR